MERTLKPEAEYTWEAKAVKGRVGGPEARTFVSAYDVGLDEPTDGGKRSRARAVALEGAAVRDGEKRRGAVGSH